jgi:hypothetical protein
MKKGQAVFVSHPAHYQDAFECSFINSPRPYWTTAFLSSLFHPLQYVIIVSIFWIYNSVTAGYIICKSVIGSAVTVTLAMTRNYKIYIMTMLLCFFIVISLSLAILCPIHPT